MRLLKDQILELSNKRFLTYLICIAAAYLSFEFYYVAQTAFSVDEFYFARHILDYTHLMPYRDFEPYKTILGYYLLSIPMFFSHHFLLAFFYIKDEIAIINTFFLFFVTYAFANIFDRRAALLAALAILSNCSFLIYSSELRVDLLAAWFCLISMLFILKNRMNSAGIALAIAFLISQKAMWYVLAINVGLLVSTFSFPKSDFTLKSIFKFNLCFILPILFYISAWALVSSPTAIIRNIFYEAYVQLGIDWYSQIYFFCWRSLLNSGAMLFFCWPLAFMMLFRGTIKHPQKLFVITSASIALLLFIHYKQPFLYNFVFTTPALFVLWIQMLEWVLFETHDEISNQTAIKTKHLAILAFYIWLLYALNIIFSLHWINLLLLLFPICIYILKFQTISNRIQKILSGSIVIIFSSLAIFYPLYTIHVTIERHDGQYQHTMMTIANRLLDSNDSYIVGFPLLITKDQKIKGLINLIGPQIDYLFNQDPKLKPLLLSSLYLTPTTQDDILKALSDEPIKFIMIDGRTLLLPKRILTYFEKNYQHYYGSIYLYGPLIEKNTKLLSLKFSGIYRIEGISQPISIDGQKIFPHAILMLKKGDHTFNTHQNFRLVFIPNIKKNELNTEFYANNWLNMIKPVIL